MNTRANTASSEIVPSAVDGRLVGNARRLRRWAAGGAMAAVLVGIVVSATGCAAILKSMAIMGDGIEEDVSARYAGLPGKTLAIIVYTPEAIPFEYPRIHYEVGTFVQREIDRRLNSRDKPRVGFVDQRQIVAFQESNPYWGSLSASDLAARFGADRIMFLEIMDFSTRDPDAPELYLGQMSGRVLIVDPNRREDDALLFDDDIDDLRWPENQQIGIAEASDAQIREALLTTFADRVVKNFYDHTRKVE